jgi:ubiquitin-protein ligase
LQDLRVDYTPMKVGDTYSHLFAGSIRNTAPNMEKLVRLAQELADMSSSLPIDYTNSIFVRCDVERVDVAKCCIFGAKGTPYAFGAYVYDVYFDDDYPRMPPKCKLWTTGGGKVRFNPNLYACGKVCLSLLGTWRGNATENWDPNMSTLLQTLLSIQAIIMSDDVYYNEPGYEGEAGTVEGDRKNEAYSNIGYLLFFKKVFIH